MDDVLTEWAWRGLVVVETVVAPTYKGYRYPIEVIGHAVWLYHRFALSLRDVEELMSSRGVVVTYESIRAWCATFGPDYAKKHNPRSSPYRRLSHCPPTSRI